MYIVFDFHPYLVCSFISYEDIGTGETNNNIIVSLSRPTPADAIPIHVMTSRRSICGTAPRSAFGSPPWNASTRICNRR